MSQHFTDFSEYTTSVQPSDWTNFWASSSLTTRDDALFTGGKYAELTEGGSYNRIAFSWDAVDAISADQEILVKFRMVTGGIFEPSLRASGSAESARNGYILLVRESTNGVDLRKAISGKETSLGTSSITLTNGVDYWVRFRAEGTTISAKVWADGDTEPASWDISVTNSDVSTVGRVQIGTTGNSTSNFKVDLVGVGLAGDDAPSETPSSGSTFSNGYLYRRKITIDSTKVSGSVDLTDTTIPFAGVYTYLKSVANGGKVESSVGNDIRFETTTGIKINHDLAYYDPTTGAIEAWVKQPTITYSVDQEYYVYYGKPGATPEEDKANAWHSDFDSVYHLNENMNGTSGEVKDSKGSFDGTGGNGVSNECPTQTTGVTGIANQGQTFDPTTYQQHINFGDVHDVRTSDKTTIAFAKTTATTTAVSIVAKSLYGGTSNRFYPLGFADTGELQAMCMFGATNIQTQWADSPAHNDNTWRMYTSRVDRSASQSIIVDGVVKNSTSISAYSATDVNNTNDFLIGCYNDPDGVGRHNTYGAWDGEIDEVWIITGIRSDDWLVTVRNAVISPSTFYSVGDEETAGSVVKSIEYLDKNANTTTQTTFTFSSQTLGVEASDRYIILGISARKAGITGTISSVTIGGVSATIINQVANNTGSNNSTVGLAIALVPSGATGDIVVTMSEAFLRCGIAFWRATGLESATPNDQGTSTATNPTTDLDIGTSGGFAIGLASSATSTSGTLTNIDEDFDIAFHSFLTHFGGHKEYLTEQTALTVTTTPATSASPAGAFASWNYASSAPVTSNLKYWNGSAWVAVPAKVYNGSAFVDAVIKYWNGSAWVAI